MQAICLKPRLTEYRRFSSDEMARGGGGCLTSTGYFSSASSVVTPGLHSCGLIVPSHNGSGNARTDAIGDPFGTWQEDRGIAQNCHEKTQFPAPLGVHHLLELYGWPVVVLTDTALLSHAIEHAAEPFEDQASEMACSTCGESARPEAGWAYVIEVLQARRHTLRTIRRW
jgi:S-adenosylmethionine/arginine decarboxylase-like enzyme